MIAFQPDFDADLIPGVSAAGFRLGETVSDISRRIGNVRWYESDSSVKDVLAKNDSWVGVRIKCGSALELNESILSYVYSNETVSLFFGSGARLYRIAVGKGYRGSFYGVRPGDNLQAPGKIDVLFNDMDDDFLILKDEAVLQGISIVTDFRSDFEYAPNQVIQFISIHDWSLQYCS